jgi:hypothetical protein
MTYPVGSNEIAILYNGATYVVNLTSDPTQFYIKSPISGNAETVDQNTAAHLFGAEQAYSTLGRAYGIANVTAMPTYWDNVLQSDAQILGWVGASTTLSSIAGLVLGEFLTGAGTVAGGAATTFETVTNQLAPSLADIAYSAAADGMRQIF